MFCLLPQTSTTHPFILPVIPPNSRYSGNAEQMKDPKTGEPHTAHTTLDVPIVVLGAPKGASLDNGRLCDVAPTVLALMGIERPAVMTGHSLLKKG